MPDLWKALGDVYGDADPQGSVVAAEPVVAERAAPRLKATLPLDDDLAAALSAALVNAPAPGAAAPQPAMVPTTPVTPIAVEAPAAGPVQPRAAAGAISSAEPVAPAPTTPDVSPTAAVPGGAQHQVTSWIAEVEHRQAVRERGPDLDAAVPTGPTWSRTDDDIIPTAKGKRGRRR